MKSIKPFSENLTFNNGVNKARINFLLKRELEIENISQKSNIFQKP